MRPFFGSQKWSRVSIVYAGTRRATVGTAIMPTVDVSTGLAPIRPNVHSSPSTTAATTTTADTAVGPERNEDTPWRRLGNGLIGTLHDGKWPALKSLVETV